MATRPANQEHLHLRLYVAGHAPNSLRAVANATAICERHFAAAYELEIVDLLEQPLRALADSIVVTPTLLRLMPLPVRRMVGDLEDEQKTLLLLSER